MSSNIEHLPTPGLLVSPDALRTPRAKSVVEVLQSGKLAFARFVECRASSDEPYQETVVFDVEVQRPQVLAADIRCEERIAAVFPEIDDRYPRVFALRANFPEVPHLNQEEQEFPRSLCLYDQPWADLKLTWTAYAFVEKEIRRWLSLTSEGRLHADDQPLEPVILGYAGHIVVPYDLFQEEGDLPERLNVKLVGDNDEIFFIARRPEDRSITEKGLNNIATVLKCEPREHGILSRIPKNLKELSELTSKAELDLLSELRTLLMDWTGEEDQQARLILIIQFPKTRYRDGRVEEIEQRAFLILNTVREVGVGIGIWVVHEGGLSGLVEPDLEKDGSEIAVGVLNLHRAFHWEMAATLNALSGRDERRITAIGAGALGSQVIMNLARAGFGIWTIIDNDVVLPHNLARYGLGAYAVGHSKAFALSITVNELGEDLEFAKPIKGDVTTPGDQENEIQGALDNAELILDMAASVSVSRYLARHPSSGRRIALFMNPTGRDLVLLAEDTKREVKLDCLEMQYYRSLVTDDRLQGHFTSTERPIRYGQSCRDLSARIPQDLVALHAGIAAMAFKKVAVSEEATIRIWKTDPDLGDVELIDVPVAPVIEEEHSGWTLVVDFSILQKVGSLRVQRLPNETGGILIGAHDMERKIVYVVDALSSPPDSVEWPTLYLRGCKGLADRVEEIQEITGQNLNYVGEWHSHPDGAAVSPGEDDRKLLAWLAEEMSVEGKPPIMLIVGEGGTARFFSK